MISSMIPTLFFIYINFIIYRHNNALDFNEAKKNIYNYLDQIKLNNNNNINNNNNTCVISRRESCDLNKMLIDESNLIQPGGNTRCLFSYSTPFVFQVIKLS
jgi:hypothetical protein